MSTIEDVPQPVEESPLPTGSKAGAQATQPGRNSRRRWVPITAAAATLALAGGGVAAWMITHRAVPATAPVTLPATMGGLPVLAENNQYETPAWRLKARTAAAGTAFDAKLYGKSLTTRSIRLVAARTDLTGKLELAWAADAGHEVGSARCTHNTKLTASGQPRNRPTVLVCWRTSPTVSVYSVIIDPKATEPVPDADGAAAVDAGWKAARQAR